MLFRFARLYWLTVLLTVLSVFTALHLLTRSDKSAFKLSLVFLILLLPVFGGAFYWIFHFQTGAHGSRDSVPPWRKRQADEHSLLEQAKKECPRDAKLLTYLQSTAAFPVLQGTQSRYFPSGEQMLSSLLADLEKARHYIFLEYFLIEEGVMWDSILEVLKRKAAQGVDVRVIYDDFGSLLTLPADYTATLGCFGIRCVAFNRFHPFLTTLQNNRDHRKITVIDGSVAYTGGINLADEYIDKKIRFGKWKDCAIRLQGDAASAFTDMFLEMWSYITHTEEDPRRYRLTDQPSYPNDGWIQPYTDSPMDKPWVGEQVYLHAIHRTQRYLYITTPYLMVGDELLSALKYCAQSGIDVRIITPGKPDKPLVHFTTRSYYRELLRAGVRIYEYTEGFIHAKSFLSDGDFAIVGTVNMDFRSLYLLFECGVCLYRSSAAASLLADFSQTLPLCRPITEKDCKRNPIAKLLQDILRIFAPLM